MRKLLIVGCIFTAVLFSANAQAFYADAGFGFGRVNTSLDGNDISDTFKTAGISVNETGIDLGVKAGYGPIANIPLYIVGTFVGTGHRLTDVNGDYFQYNSYLIGPGIIFYPIPLIQLAGSFGYSFTGNQTSLPETMLGSTGGLAGEASAAIDLGKGNHGLLLGLKYFWATNTLETIEVEQNTSAVSIFVRYALRQKL